MVRDFIQTKEFSKAWDMLGLTDDDLCRVENEIMRFPDKYPVIKGSGGLRKLRLAGRDKGKSGSYRVIFADFPQYETTYLITVFTKNQKENLSMHDRGVLKRMMILLERGLKEAYDERVL